MQLEQYEIENGDEANIFEFISTGAKGAIRKRVAFQRTQIPNVYNLAFGDINTITNQFDDSIVSNNGDMTKVLATIAGTIYSFTDTYPAAFIYFSGSSPARTRLYQIGISKYFYVLLADFEVYGEIMNNWEHFTINQHYTAFLIKRKTI